MVVPRLRPPFSGSLLLLVLLAAAVLAGGAATARSSVLLEPHATSNVRQFGSSSVMPVGVQARIRALTGSALTTTISQLRSIGVTYTREDFTWTTIEPTKGQFKWGATDTWVGAAAKAGLGIIAVLDAPPAWATSAWNVAPTSATAMAAYANFTAAVVSRYGSTGTFWSQNPNVPKVPIEYYDVWNEPYYSGFWHRTFLTPSATRECS